MTRFWMIRHAIVAENERARLYGVLDVQLCPDSLVRDVPVHRALATFLPQPADWIVTPLSRTRRTAEAIFAGGYEAQELAVEPALIEQDLGDYQGLEHKALPPLLATPAHPFWPLSGDERPPNGESFDDMIGRVSEAMDRLATEHDGRDVVIVSHGGTIRAAVAHALGVSARNALHLSVHNLSLTRLNREPAGWRVVSVNEGLGL